MGEYIQKRSVFQPPQLRPIMRNVVNQPNHSLRWYKTALLGLTFGACVASCQTTLPEPQGSESQVELRKPAAVRDSTITAEAPPKDVNAGG